MKDGKRVTHEVRVSKDTNRNLKLELILTYYFTFNLTNTI